MFFYYIELPIWAINLALIVTQIIPLVMAASHHVDNIDITDECVAISKDEIRWINIDHIAVRRSKLENRYVAFYFREDIPPKGYDIERFYKKEEIIRKLKEYAAINHFEFSDESQEEKRNEVYV